MAKLELKPRLGRYVETLVAGERVRAYLPPALPPRPSLDLLPLVGLIEEANRALGRLDGLTTILPDTSLFIYMYVRKEAVLSSQIEGTQSSLSDLLLHEEMAAPGAPIDDVEEVSSYVAAMEHGLHRLREGFPLSLRLIREMHGVLLAKGRGSTKTPGEFRRSQNWIGGRRPSLAAYVPPPVSELMPCLDAFERFLHATDPNVPTLIKAALVHVQFETIHPFLDGNGRIGRLLITLLLCVEGALREPTLYLSLFLKANRARYYEMLQAVREDGDWEGWVEFFLTGVKETAEGAADAARRILALLDEDRSRIETLGRQAPSALRLHQYMRRRPLIAIPRAAENLGLGVPTVARSVEQLVRVGILRETTGRQRGRLFAYDKYLAILSEGTEPLPR